MPEPKFWILYDRAGCAAGSTHVRNAATAEDAHAMLVPDWRRRRDQQAAGWRLELVDNPTFDAAVPCLMGVCGHRKAAAK